jgi:hypothetical protein
MVMLKRHERENIRLLTAGGECDHRMFSFEGKEFMNLYYVFIRCLASSDPYKDTGDP